MGNILLVDDDDQLRDSFYNLLTMEGYSVRAVASGEDAIVAAEQELPDVAIMDVRMPGMDGLATLKILHQKEPRLPIIIMTAYSTTEAAIEATKFGAFDYVLKPFEIPDILQLLGKAIEASRLMREKVLLESDDALCKHGRPSLKVDALVGTSRAMHEVYKAIGRVAPTEAVVLLRGESGTGKELVARAVYQHSLRANKPFTVVNCVAIPDTLLESELFGYEKGSFTGASSRRVGKIEQASGGTVFLDEIGDMPTSIQAKLLRLLQENQIERLGGREPIDVDVRIIAATNRDLEKAVTEGRFREDLFYRLNVITLRLPPLRERAEDIPHLAEHFLHRLSLDKDIPLPAVSAGAMAALARHPWFGNVRELKNLLQKLIVFNRGETISPNDVATALGETPQHTPLPPEMQDSLHSQLQLKIRGVLEQSPGENCFEQLMDSMGMIVVKEALDISKGNRSQAARMLGLSRPTLLAKMERYGLS